jgi:hypothetical protein
MERSSILFMEPKKQISFLVGITSETSQMNGSNGEVRFRKVIIEE